MRNHRTKLGALFSEGARRLWSIVERERLTRRAVATRVGYADVSRWLYGDTRPPFAAMVAMRRLWSIPIESWAQPPKRVFVPPAQRAA